MNATVERLRIAADEARRSPDSMSDETPMRQAEWAALEWSCPTLESASVTSSSDGYGPRYFRDPTISFGGHFVPLRCPLPHFLHRSPRRSRIMVGHLQAVVRRTPMSGRKYRRGQPELTSR